MNFKIMLKINSHLSHYNHEKYWKMKFKLRDQKGSIIIRYFYMYRMKKMEARNNAALGTRIHGGSFFESKPHLPHGIKGIFISDFAEIGKNAVIFQQVTIGIKDYVGGGRKGTSHWRQCFYWSWC